MLFFRGIECFDFSFTKIVQDTTEENWFKFQLQEHKPFFYLLEWSELKNKKTLKFGYKVGIREFKRNYAKIHHRIPTTSIIWVLNNYDKKKDRFYSIQQTFHSVEQDILQTLKTQKHFRLYKETKEYFYKYCVKECEATVDLHVEQFNFTKSFNIQLDYEARRDRSKNFSEFKRCLFKKTLL